MIDLKYYKIEKDAYDPVFSTLESACFDLRAYLNKNTSIDVYDAYNSFIKIDSFSPSHNTDKLCFKLWGQCRALIPTGLIFDIPKNYSIRLHPRSGLAWNNGITFANCEGIIDADYTHELKIMMCNTSKIPLVICDGDRICQGELVLQIHQNVIINETAHIPQQRGDRIGGLGSTGI